MGSSQPCLGVPKIRPHTHRLCKSLDRVRVIPEGEISASLDPEEHPERAIFGAEHDCLFNQGNRIPGSAEEDQRVGGLGIGSRKVLIDLYRLIEGVEGSLMVSIQPMDEPKSVMRERSVIVETYRFLCCGLCTLDLSPA